jgi:chromosome segregation ATPase
LEAKYTKLQEEYNSLNEFKIQIEIEISIKIQENKNITEQISILQNELKKRDEEKALFETQYSNLEKEIDTFKSCLKISKDENNLLTESINQMNNHFEKVENDIIEKNNEIETFKLKLEEQFFSLVQENSQNSNLVINIKNLNSELIILNQNLENENKKLIWAI